MWELISKLFDISDFPARWYCGNWSETHGWLHILSDLAVFGAYTAIPCVLAYFILKRKDFGFPSIFWLFCIFIFSCGMVHLVEAFIFWVPVYRVSGVLKLITAISSWATVIVLIRLTPTALNLPSLAIVNAQLENEIENRKKIQFEIAKKEEQYRSILDHAIDGFILINQKGIIENANQACEKIFGYTTDEILGQNVNILMPNPYHDEHDQYLQNYLDSGNAKIIGIGREVTGKRKNGDEFPVDLSISQFVLDGKYYFSGIVRDITDKKVAEREVEEKNKIAEQMKIAQLSSQIGYIVNTVKNIELLLQQCCTAIVNHLEISVSRIWLKHDDDFLQLTAHSGNQTVNIERIEQSDFGQYLTGQIALTKQHLITNDIQERNDLIYPNCLESENLVAFAGYPILYEDNLLGVVTIFSKNPITKPITKALESISYMLAVGIHRIQSDEELSILNANLVEQSKSLQRSNEDLQSFAYSASHDLQEPLRTVSNYLHLLKRKHGMHLNEDALTYISNANASTDRMKTLIQDLLEYSRVATRGKEFETVNLSTIMTFVVENLDHMINETSTSIKYSNLPDVFGDFSQLVQLFQNIIQNAMKYKSELDPVITVSAKKVNDRVHFSIADNGIGINPEYRTRIFDIFKRLHTRDEYSGNGVGLSLCKKIVERHQGTIWCDSNPNGGTTFYFTLPLPPDELS